MILTDEERALIALQHLQPEADDIHHIMRYTDAIEAAVIRNLAGVSVEPVGYLSEHTSQGLWKYQFNKELAEVYKDNAITIDQVFTLDQLTTAIAAAHEAGRKSVHDSCVDLWKEEVIAAARVQAIKDCEDAIETANARRVLYVPDCIDAIRALIGKEST